MKVTKIRLGVFETNSSSTHSITICSPQDWKDLQAGVCKDQELVAAYTEYKDYMDSELEIYAYEKSTPNGEKIILFGHYGYDG